jgi:hypothetical protein
VFRDGALNKVKRKELGFVVNRGEELSRSFTGYDQDFDIDFGSAALGGDFMLLLSGLHVKQGVPTQHLLQDRGNPRKS